jgi:molybdate transport system regulatory protein
MRIANKTIGARLRIVLAQGVAFGPGKADLLEAIDQHASLTAAARALGMSYRRAWLMAEELNRIFDEPLIITVRGGRGGGGRAELSSLGAEVLGRYRSITARLDKSMAADLRRLRARLAKGS